MSTTSVERWGALLLGTCAIASSASADKILTNDGRYFDVVKARESEDGYTLEFEHGVVETPADFVQSVEIEGNMEDYVPQDDREQQMLEDGYVRYQGKWWKQVAYENELRKQAEESAERTAELAEHSDWRGAYELETKHFLFRSNTTPELLEHYAELIEQFYSDLNRRIPIKPPPDLRRIKLPINIFKNTEDFYEFARSARPGVLGYFTWYDHSLNFFHDFQDPDLTNVVALHECTHLLTYLIDPQFDPPIWLNEGIADWLGTCNIEVDDRGRFELEPGQLQMGRVLTVQEAMRSGNDVTLEELIRVPNAGFTAFHYAHGWSFVYFLNNTTDAYKKGFDKLFRDLYTVKKGIEYAWEPSSKRGGTAKYVAPDEIERLLLEYLKVDSLDELEEEWKEFVAAIEIDTPEALFQRGYRAIYNSFDEDEERRALEDLDKAIDLGIQDPRAFAARAEAHSRNLNRSAAIADLRRAVELSPLQPSYRFALGRELSGYHSFFSSTGRLTVRISSGSDRRPTWYLDGSLSENEEALAQFGLAMEMDPENVGFSRYYDEYVEVFERWKDEEGHD